jgi:hypothetical protein
MKIPKSFKIFGITWKVELVEEMSGVGDGREQLGACHHTSKEIEIRTKAQGMQISKILQLETFWHEAFHAVLESCGYPELSNDEHFVELMGNAITQVVATSDYK